MLFALAVSLPMSACDSLDDYGGTFEGSIIGGNFVRRCFPAETRATLEFDPDKAVAVDAIPSEFNLLSTTDGTFDETPLVPLTALPHDQLSALDFPGPKRLRNFLLMARPESGPLAGRDAVVVVSMLEKGSVEVRVMARSADDSDPCDVDAAEAAEGFVADPHEYFGIFQLSD